ncbi:hypothetical protein COY06_01790 [Candidatus Peregrinibacteria bacterium CG_4_10_14_0_2_um_filter_41_8]|nr:MAG: hypothetical protein COY06_01790 [Candidatus Peregrinibacteria bacterium CG_4_10_14_0_2_um_filter_41_8]
MNKRKGFSLLEVIFALAIITITFVAVASLVSRNLQSNLLNQSYITANYLNSEAVEIVRNMRDSNWLQNFSFNANSDRLWGESLWPRGGSSSIVQIDRRNIGDSPWIMRATGPIFEANKLYLAKNNKG